MKENITDEGNEQVDNFYISFRPFLLQKKLHDPKCKEMIVSNTIFI